MYKQKYLKLMRDILRNFFLQKRNKFPFLTYPNAISSNQSTKFDHLVILNKSYDITQRKKKLETSVIFVLKIAICYNSNIFISKRGCFQW